MIEITREVAQKVRDVVAQGLTSGLGVPEPGKMCVEAAVCFALGLPHGDDPGCVSPALRRLKIRLNDASWPSDAARATGLRRLALAQLGSASVLDDCVFVARVAEMTIRTVVPIALRAAASINPTQAAALEASAVACERDGTVLSARDAATDATYAATYATDAATDALYAAANAAANAATDAAIYATYAAATYAAATVTYAIYAADANAATDAAAAYAASAALYAADAATYATYAAAYAAANAATDAAAAYAAYAAHSKIRVKVLGDFAERVVQILIDMKAPGCEFLDLVPIEAAS